LGLVLPGRGEVSRPYAGDYLGQRRLALWSRCRPSRARERKGNCQIRQTGTHYRTTALNWIRPITSFIASLMLLTCALQAAPKNPPALISQGRDGKLAYDLDKDGNRIPDFSTSGYKSGEDMPYVPVRVTVAPINGDATAVIQRAINYAGSLPSDTNGFRGAVLLLKGRHNLLGSLDLTNSGVVLRGQ